MKTVTTVMAPSYEKYNGPHGTGKTSGIYFFHPSLAPYHRMLDFSLHVSRTSILFCWLCRLAFMHIQLVPKYSPLTQDPSMPSQNGSFSPQGSKTLLLHSVWLLARVQVS